MGRKHGALGDFFMVLLDREIGVNLWRGLELGAEGGRKGERGFFGLLKGVFRLSWLKDWGRLGCRE